MAKNELAMKKRGKDFTEVTQILKNPSQRAKFQNYIDEAVNVKLSIQSKQEEIKSLRSSCSEDLNLDPKVFNDFVSLHYNNNFEQKKAEVDRWEDILHTLEQLQLTAN
jgi:hypothetical protein